MAPPLKSSTPPPTTVRRSVEVATRQPVELPGRVMFSDRVELPCMAISISNREFEVLTPKEGAIGERVVCYFEDIQRIEGEIIEIADRSFVAKILTPIGARDKTAARIRWVLDKGTRNDNREAARIEPIRKSVELKIGESHVKARLLDVSVKGAAIETSERPGIGKPITVGHIRAKVVRQMDRGIAVEFMVPLPIGSFDENIRL